MVAGLTKEIVDSFVKNEKALSQNNGDKFDNSMVEIINLWDPIGLFPMAPKDEYETECKEIHYFLESNKEVKETELSKKINDIFSKRFGV